MPSADMQKDKTVMIGWLFLNKEMTPVEWPYNTMNYYLNITGLEISYDLTLNKGRNNGYWLRGTLGKVRESR